ncbi:histone H1B-like [Nilaparvata lugens]|uniref:histone H1B-like n=1 Tax=Nilaparvata lugens TaxID=108931 RepID=UPI00193C96BC|nr:histone H1B-like [Nilaparvata lugens]
MSAETATSPAATVPAASTPVKAKKAAASKAAASSKKPRANPAHPPTGEMVNAAIAGFKEHGGSSLQAIKKYIAANYKADAEKLAPFIKKYLKTAVASGALTQPKGKGAAGSFKISVKEAAKGAAPKPASAKPKSAQPKKKKPTAAGAKPKKAVASATKRKATSAAAGEKKKAAASKPAAAKKSSAALGDRQ